MLSQTCEIIVDPITKKSLKFLIEKTSGKHVTNGKLVSESGTQYYIENGIANLVPTKEDIKITSDLLSAWEELQKNGLEVYGKFPEFNCSITGRKETLLFKKFCSFRGRVLDVGCGPIIPGYLQDNQNIELAIGIDPLISFQNGELRENIDLIRAMGEFLPFKERTFDIVSFATSFDHVIEPEKVLKESIRVLQDDGLISFWIESDPQQLSVIERAKRKAKRTILNTISQNTKRKMVDMKKQAQIANSMHIPQGAIDPFHLRHYQYSQFNELCESLNLRKVEEEKVESIKSVFVKYQMR